MIRTNTGGDGEFQLPSLGQALSGEIAGVEAGQWVSCGISRWCRETYGVVMMTSASTSSLSKVELSVSLSEVVTKVWPCSSSHFLKPSSFSVVPRRPGCCLACSPPYGAIQLTLTPAGLCMRRYLRHIGREELYPVGSEKRLARVFQKQETV